MAIIKDRPPIKCDLVGTHELDPDGDVILVFNSKHIIVSDPDAVDLINAEDWNAMVEVRSEDEEENEGHKENAMQSAAEEDTDQRTSEPEAEETQTGGVQEGQQAAQPEEEDEEADEADEEEEEEEASEEEEDEPENTYELGSADIEFRVSSRHLSLLSPYFRVLLSRKFAEGEELHASGQVKITLEDDPADGAKILLGLIHFNCCFPELTPSLMMQIAVLVDKWNLSGPLAYWIRKMWETVKSNLPESWNADSINYLKMLHMLKLQDEGIQLAELVSGAMTDETCCDYPPIQQAIETLQQHRITVLNEARSSISTLIHRYFPQELSAPIICNHQDQECDALVLGVLIKGFAKYRLYPFPVAPYRGISINFLCSVLESIDLKSCCHKYDRSRGKRYCRRCHRKTYLPPGHGYRSDDHCPCGTYYPATGIPHSSSGDCSYCGEGGECNSLKSIILKLKAATEADFPWTK